MLASWLWVIAWNSHTYNKSYRSRLRVPGFEPGISPPQGEVLTTILHTPGEAGYRSLYLSHAKRALYHLSYIPPSSHRHAWQLPLLWRFGSSPDIEIGGCLQTTAHTGSPGAPSEFQDLCRTHEILCTEAVGWKRQGGLPHGCVFDEVSRGRQEVFKTPSWYHQYSRYCRTTTSSFLSLPHHGFELDSFEGSWPGLPFGCIRWQ